MSALHCFCLSKKSSWLLLILTGIFCLCNRMIFAAVGLPTTYVSLNKLLRLSAPNSSSGFSWTPQSLGWGFSIWAQVGVWHPVSLSIKYLVLFSSLSLTDWCHASNLLKISISRKLLCACHCMLMGNEPKLKILYLKCLKLSSWCQILLNFMSMKGRCTPMPNAEHSGSVCYSSMSMILFQKNLNPVSPKVQDPLFGVKSRTVHCFNPGNEHFWLSLSEAKLVAHHNLIPFSAQMVGHAYIHVLSLPGSGEPLLEQCNVDQTLDMGTMAIHESWTSNKHLLLCGSRKVFLENA